MTCIFDMDKYYKEFSGYAIGKPTHIRTATEVAMLSEQERRRGSAMIEFGLMSKLQKDRWKKLEMESEQKFIRLAERILMEKEERLNKYAVCLSFASETNPILMIIEAKSCSQALGRAMFENANRGTLIGWGVKDTEISDVKEL